MLPPSWLGPNWLSPLAAPGPSRSIALCKQMPAPSSGRQRPAWPSLTEPNAWSIRWGGGLTATRPPATGSFANWIFQKCFQDHYSGADLLWQAKRLSVYIQCYFPTQFILTSPGVSRVRPRWKLSRDFGSLAWVATSTGQWHSWQQSRTAIYSFCNTSDETSCWQQLCFLLEKPRATLVRYPGLRFQSTQSDRGTALSAQCAAGYRARARGWGSCPYPLSSTSPLLQNTYFYLRSPIGPNQVWWEEARNVSRVQVAHSHQLTLRRLSLRPSWPARSWTWNKAAATASAGPASTPSSK